MCKECLHTSCFFKPETWEKWKKIKRYERGKKNKKKVTQKDTWVTLWCVYTYLSVDRAGMWEVAHRTEPGRAMASKQPSPFWNEMSKRHTAICWKYCEVVRRKTLWLGLTHLHTNCFKNKHPAAWTYRLHYFYINKLRLLPCSFWTIPIHSLNSLAVEPGIKGLNQAVWILLTVTNNTTCLTAAGVKYDVEKVKLGKTMWRKWMSKTLPRLKNYHYERVCSVCLNTDGLRLTRATTSDWINVWMTVKMWRT